MRWVSDDLDSVSTEPADAIVHDADSRHAIVSSRSRDDGGAAAFDTDIGSILDNVVYETSQQQFSNSSSS